MGKIVLNVVATRGVVGAERVESKPSEHYRKLVEASKTRIMNEQKNCAITYQKAATYLAKY